MKHIKWLAVLGLVLIGFSSCEKETIGDMSNLFGLWREQSDNEYMRFLTAEQEPMEGEYYFGKEWDEDDDVYEGDLKYKGNGWFKWKMSDKALIMIFLMDNGGAELPRTYPITRLTNSELVLQDFNDKNDKDTWLKQ